MTGATVFLWAYCYNRLIYGIPSLGSKLADQSLFVHDGSNIISFDLLLSLSEWLKIFTKYNMGQDTNLTNEELQLIHLESASGLFATKCHQIKKTKPTHPLSPQKKTTTAAQQKRSSAVQSSWHPTAPSSSSSSAVKSSSSEFVSLVCHNPRRTERLGQPTCTASHKLVHIIFHNPAGSTRQSVLASNTTLGHH